MIRLFTVPISRPFPHAMLRFKWSKMIHVVNPYTIRDTLEMQYFCVAYNGRIGPEVPDIPLIVCGLHMQFLKLLLKLGGSWGGMLDNFGILGVYFKEFGNQEKCLY